MVPLLVATWAATRGDTTIGNMLSTFLVVHVLVAAVTTGLLIWFVRSRDMKTLNEIREEMEKRLQQNAMEFERPESIAARLQSRLPGLWQEQKLSRSYNDDPQVKRVQSALLRSIKVSPRVFKRWTTRLRLALALANSRNLLQNGTITTRQLAAWTLLQELGTPQSRLRSITKPVQRQLSSMRP
jgi:hypothetical protein